MRQLCYCTILAVLWLGGMMCVYVWLAEGAPKLFLVTRLLGGDRYRSPGRGSCRGSPATRGPASMRSLKLYAVLARAIKPAHVEE
jgi:hypothetical protein